MYFTRVVEAVSGKETSCIIVIPHLKIVTHWAIQIYYLLLEELQLDGLLALLSNIGLGQKWQAMMKNYHSIKDDTKNVTQV
jgi:hypothetical protein